MTEEIKKVFELSCLAPSGDNSQPWKFKKRSDFVWELINIPDRDNEIFNYQQRGSYIAHGALLQNIFFAGQAFGLETDIKLFPQKGDDLVTATLTFSEKPDKNDEEKKYIKLITDRATNRKKYFGGLLTDEKITQFSSLSPTYSACVQILNKKSSIEEVAKAASTAERVMLQYQPLHQAFFSKIRWSKKEENQRGFGLLIDTLELNPAQKIIFKWFSNWTKSKILRRLKLPDLVANENIKIYASAGAVGIITIPQDGAENFIHTGMLLEKIWLKSTELGLSFQPIAGVLYLDKRLESEGLPGLPENLKTLISESAERISSTFSQPKKNISMLFRLGEADKPSARSQKSQPIILGR